MNSFGKYVLKISCVLTVAAFSFSSAYYFTSTPATYSKFISSAANSYNAFNIGTWVKPEFKAGVIFETGALSVSKSVCESVYSAVYAKANSADGFLFAYITLPEDCDLLGVDTKTVKLKYESNQADALNIKIGERSLRASFDWNEVIPWIESSGKNCIDVIVTGKSKDDSFTFSGAGLIEKYNGSRVTE